MGFQTVVRRRCLPALFCVFLPWLAAACGAEADLVGAPFTAFNAPSMEPADGLHFEDAAHHCGPYTLPDPSPVGTCRAEHAAVRNFDQTLFEGTVDVTACVARITAGQKLPYHHDGIVFHNNEGRLPQAPAGFYHEYVDPTPGLSGPGPQRLVWGGHRVWFYSPDHYASFIQVQCS